MWQSEIQESLSADKRSSAQSLDSKPTSVRILPFTQRFFRQPELEREFTRDWLIEKSVKVGLGTPFHTPSPSQCVRCVCLRCS